MIRPTLLLAGALMLSTGCAAVPSLPEWQDISAEREARKQDTLQHIDRTRGQAAEIEQASFAKAPHPQAVVPPGRTADRLTPPAGAALEPIAAAVDPSLTADPILNADAVQPTPEQSLRAEADRAVAMGDLEEAIRLYRQLIAKQPKNAELHHALALVAEQMDLHDDASRHYREAMRLAPAEHLYRLCYEAHADRLASETPPGSAVR